jgi:hypothetical protein
VQPPRTVFQKSPLVGLLHGRVFVAASGSDCRSIISSAVAGVAGHRSGLESTLRLVLQGFWCPYRLASSRCVCRYVTAAEPNKRMNEPGAVGGQGILHGGT